MNNKRILPSLTSSLEEHVDRIIACVERRQAFAHASAKIFETPFQSEDGEEISRSMQSSVACVGGPLTLRELCQLVSLCSNSSTLKRKEKKGSEWNSVDVESLLILCPMLIMHIESASHVDIIGEALNAVNGNGKNDERNSILSVVFDSWLHPSGQGYNRLYVLRSGIEASLIFLSIITTPNIDRRIISEDGIQACVLLLRQHLGKSIIMAMSNTGHLSGYGDTKASTISNKKTGRKRKRKENEKNEMIQPQDQNIKSNSNLRNKKEIMEMLKQVYKPILSTIGSVQVMIEQIEMLIEIVQLDDQPILSLAWTALLTFTIDPQRGSYMSQSHNIQESALLLLSCIFQRYSKHRHIIVEDLFPIMLKLPKSKKMLRTYTISTSIGACYNNDFKNSFHREGGFIIQPIVALVISLVQGCVTNPVPTTKKWHDSCNSKDIILYSNGLSACMNTCDYFVLHLLRRCAQKGEDGGASEFRPILSNFIEDLLSMHLLPEYPATDMLLYSISRNICHDLLKFAQTGSNTFESTYVATAMDALGKICAGAARCLKTYKNSSFNFFEKRIKHTPKTDYADMEAEMKARNECFCRRHNLIETFMLDCDRCHAWFHGSCVDVAKDKLPKEWICDKCRAELIVMNQVKHLSETILGTKVESSTNMETTKNFLIEYQIDKTFVLQQLLLNHFLCAHDSKEIDQIQKAREFHIAKWIQLYSNRMSDKIQKKESKEQNKSQRYKSILELEKMSRHFLAQFKFQETKKILEQLPLEANTALVLALTVKSYDVINAFPNMLGVVVKLMDNKAVIFRKLAVKAISQVISVDPNIMVQPIVKNAVSCRFSDDSISVREAAIALVGSFVLQVPLVAETFHVAILTRLNDKGISVRKRAVRIFRDVLLSFPNYRGLVSACSKMLQLAANPKEDDGVRELIQETFKDLWFRNENFLVKCHQGKHEFISSTSIHNNRTEGSVSNATSKSFNGAVTSYKDIQNTGGIHAYQVREIAKQIVNIVASSGSTEFLVILVKDLLYGIVGEKVNKSKENKSKKTFIELHCQSLVDIMMEEILVLEECRSSAESKDQDGEKNEEQMLKAIISTLGAFCEASPILLIKHLDIFLPYLKADNGLSKEDESILIHSICVMITRVVPLLDKAVIRRLNNGGAVRDIENVTYKFGSITLGSAIAALASLANSLHAEKDCAAKKNIMKIGKTFYTYLFKVKDHADDFSMVQPGLRNNTHRALSVLGYICRHHNILVKSDIGIANDITAVLDPTHCNFIASELISESNFFNVSFACIMFYLRKRDARTKCCAIRSLTGLFIARPRVILCVEQMGSISGLISEEAPNELKCEALKCFKEILMEEETRIESGAARKEMDLQKDITVSKKISGDQDGDSSIAGGVMTQHSNRLFELTKSTEVSIRHAAVDLVGQLLRQGLINPMEAVPHLLALQGDVGAPEVRVLARKLLIIEGEKRPDMLRQRICAGVRQAYIFQRAVYPNNRHVTAIVEEEGAGASNKNSAVDRICIFGPIFEEIVRPSKVQRQGLIKSLLTLFSNHNLNNDTQNANGEKVSKNLILGHDIREGIWLKQLPLLSYAAQILAHLPYSVSADPLFIIYQISSIVAIQGAELLDNLRQFLLPYKLANSEEDDIDHSLHDDLERAIDRKSPYWEAARKIMNKKSFDSNSFLELCAEASALVILLRLKKFLKNIYYLTDTRCMEYSPNEKERPRDKTISRSDEIPLYDSNIREILNLCADASPVERPSTGPKCSTYILIKRYCEFRQLMREGDVNSKNGERVADSNEDKCDIDVL